MPLSGAFLLLLGVTGGLCARASDLSLPAGPEPRAGTAGELRAAYPGATGAAGALGSLAPLAQLAPNTVEPPAAVAVGAPPAPAAAALTPEASANFGLATATTCAPPPPADTVDATSANPADAASLANPTAPPAAGGEAAPPAAPAVAPPPPPPPPQPPLGFSAALGVPKTRFGKLIYQTASRYALNPLLVAAMVGVESDFNPHARSRKGALGLMQMLPATARRFGMQRRRDLFNPRKNLELAGRYLRWLVSRFGDDPARVLAAYNAGEGAVDRFGGVPPFAETRDYVQRIFAHLGFTALLDVPLAAAIGGGAK
jgi:soluble lytic murein transglycosylase-like protein